MGAADGPATGTYDHCGAAPGARTSSGAGDLWRQQPGSEGPARWPHAVGRHLTPFLPDPVCLLQAALTQCVEFAGSDAAHELLTDVTVELERRTAETRPRPHENVPAIR